MTKIASAMRTSKEEVYEIMLERYGCLDKLEDGGAITITLLNKIPISKVDGHWMEYKKYGDFTAYLKIKGSSEYDTLEMSVFIDGVVSEAKELGIETATPDEIKRMKNAWVNSNRSS